LETFETDMNLTGQENLKTRKMLWGEFHLFYSIPKVLMEIADFMLSTDYTESA
jgi:hypothetical protein